MALARGALVARREVSAPSLCSTAISSVTVQASSPLGPLTVTVWPSSVDGDAGRDGDGLFADTGHGRQYTRQRTSPPTLASRAALSDITPLGVDRIEMPRPFLIGFRSRIDE